MITMGNPLNNYITLYYLPHVHFIVLRSQQSKLPGTHSTRPLWLLLQVVGLPQDCSSGGGVLSLGFIVITQGKANWQSALPKVTASVLLFTGYWLQDVHSTTCANVAPNN